VSHECLAEEFHRFSDLIFNGFYGNTELFGNFAVTHVFKSAERKNDAAFFWQSLDSGVERVLQNFLLLFVPDVAGGSVGGVGTVFWFVKYYAATGFQMIEGAVDSGAAEVGTEGGVYVKFEAFAPEFDKNFLGDVLGCVFIGQNPVDVTEQSRVVAVENLAQNSLVSGAKRSEPLLFGSVGICLHQTFGRFFLKNFYFAKVEKFSSVQNHLPHKKGFGEHDFSKRVFLLKLQVWNPNGEKFFLPAQIGDFSTAFVLMPETRPN